MNIQKRIEEAAYKETNKRESEIIKQGNKYVLKPELDYAYEKGAHFGFQLAIEMLRSREARDQSIAWAKDVEVFGNRPATAHNWSDWLDHYLVDKK